MIGPSPQLSQLRQEAQEKYGRRDREVLHFTNHTVHSDTDIFHQTAPWLSTSSAATQQMTRKCMQSYAMSPTPQPWISSQQEFLRYIRESYHETWLKQPQRAGVGYFGHTEPVVHICHSYHTHQMDPENDPASWVALTIRNTKFNTSGLNIWLANENEDIAESVSVWWTRNKDDIHFAEKTWEWAATRRQKGKQTNVSIRQP